MKKYGVSLDDDTAERVEKMLEEGDSRSRRIRNLVRLGLEAEKALLDNNWFPPSQSEREDIVCDAMSEYLEQELQ